MPTLNDQELQRLEDRFTPSLRRSARWVLAHQAWRVSRHLAEHTKRGIDIIISATALVVLMPLMFAVACLIKLTDRGPVLFWQARVGKWGQTFPFPKFRSMVMNAEALQKELMAANQHGGNGITFKMRRDPRITWIGRIIRKTSIDELPQLWCVLKGDMSLVGPRPAIEKEVARYKLDDRRRLDAMPGLTCTWQVSGRSNIPFPEQVRLDVDYIERQSLTEDIYLLLRTIPAVITGRGAY